MTEDEIRDQAAEPEGEPTVGVDATPDDDEGDD